jgi:hypothetical protein
MCHRAARVQMNLLHEEDGPVFGEFELRAGNTRGEYEFSRVRVADRTYDRVVTKNFAQWGYLVLPDSEYVQALEGTHWRGIGFLRRSRVVEEGEGWLRWALVVNEPEPVGVARGGVQRVRMVRREYAMEFFSGGAEHVAPQKQPVHTGRRR